MGWFKRKSEKEILLKKYERLLEEAYKLSHVNRTQSDAKQAEANVILMKITSLEDEK